MTGNQRDTSHSSGQSEEPEQPHPVARATYAAGSILSVALVIGLGVWGYKLLVRDVSGVPVIRASEGPMRVQPEEPGGRQALNQGLAVNDVAAVGTASTAPDKVILAPAPLDLDEEDIAGSGATEASEQETDATPDEGDAAQSDEADDDTDDDAKMRALAAALGTDAPPKENVPAADAAEAATGTSPGGVTASLRPRARPDGLRNTREATATSSEAAETREVDPETIPVGTRLAQLGAFSSEEMAREEWTRLDARFDEYLAGKDRVIQRATSGGRTFYRLRAKGFEDMAHARRFCSALVAEKAECIPVVMR